MSNPFGPGPTGPDDQPPYGQQPYPQQPGQPPYGQQPGQPPYGQPPYPGAPQPGPYGQPMPGGPQPYPGAPMGYYQPPKRKKWPWIVGGIVGVVVILGIIGAIVGKDDASKAKVGDCITSSKEPKITGCDKSDAAFRVIEKFEDTSDVSKCDTDELGQKGHVAAFYWKGGGKGVLCTTITKHTTLSDFDDLEGVPDNATQQDLDDLRNQLDEMGIEGVK